MKRTGLAIASIALCVTTHDMLPMRARACAPAYPEGMGVSVASEEALIVWDAATHTEHFIRTANFDTDAPDFGFLVPTPGVPELADADGYVFERLRDATAPEVRHESGYAPTTCCLMPFLFFTATARDSAVEVLAAGSVDILATARVAGMDATVVRASDADALTAWLDERGYATRPALTQWLAGYVERGYAITAFQYRKTDEGERRIGSSAVRLSFHADAPFYPYREPSDAPEVSGRSLRVWLVGDTRLEGALEGGGAFPAETDYAHTFDAAALHGAVPDALATGNERWLTSMVDRSTRRSPHDVVFGTSREGEVTLPPIVVRGEDIPIPIPLEPLALGGIAWFFWRRRRAKRA